MIEALLKGDSFTGTFWVQVGNVRVTPLFLVFEEAIQACFRYRGGERWLLI